MTTQPLNLEEGTQLFRLLSDPTRLRLLHLLAEERLSVAELTQVLGLAQGRVSSHLARLREAGLVKDQREGSSVYYQLADDAAGENSLHRQLASHLDDAELQSDAERARQIVSARDSSAWADSVAGRMERHYSPGRTWEATARALCELLTLKAVLDIGSGDGVLAELLAPHAHSVTCIDYSETVVAAARSRLSAFANVEIHQGDMHALPLADAGFDTAFLMHVLTYTSQANEALAEARRVLKPGGQLVVVTLAAHEHHATVESFDHCNNGYSPSQLKALLLQAGFNVERCGITSREARPPYFEVVTAIAVAC